MVNRIRVYEAGTPDVMQMEQGDVSAPSAGEVWLEQKAVGVNPLDVLQRKGLAGVQWPSGLGLEGAGIVQAVGAGVSHVQVGDRVAYATGPLGAYASARLYPAERLVKIPDALSMEAAAALMFKGVTAQYLLTTTYAVAPGTRVLIYGAAGALGQIMVAWAKHLGATVMGVVSKPQSVERAKAAGCEHVWVFDAASLPEQVRQATNGLKADVVYDSVGKASFAASLDCLRTRGLLVSFGATTGAPPAVEVATLNAKGSLYLTRPSLAAHTTNVAEYQERAKDVLDAVAKGFIQPRIWMQYPLSQAALAHADLEQGQSQGAIVLIP